VRTAQNVSEEMLASLIKGIELEDGLMKVDAISFLDPSSKKDLSVEIHSGKNRIVRRLFEHLGIEIIKLDRVYFAGLTKKTLARGKWRLMTPKEVGWLKMHK
jgi:23S rRNA pseudouridine2605 synthase